MAIAHLEVSAVQRSKGHSAVAASAYLARCELEDERTGKIENYSRAGGLLFEGVFAPADAPEWAKHRDTLWNAVEATESRKNSQTGRLMIFGLQHELTPEQNRWILQDWIKENVTRNGLIADVGIHAELPPGWKPGDPLEMQNATNLHAHLLMTTRQIGSEGFAKTKLRELDSKETLQQWRDSWEKIVNQHLKRHGHDIEIDMGRKLDGEATLHMGKVAAAMERRGVETEIGDLNREIMERRTRDLMADAAKAQRLDMARDENRQIDRAIFEIGRTDPTLAATFIKPTPEPIQIVLHDEGRTLELLGGGGSPEAPEKAPTEAKPVPAMDVAEKQPEPPQAPELEPQRPIWKDLRPEPEPKPRPSVPFFAAAMGWARDLALNVVEAAAGLLHHQREPRTMTKLGDPEFSRTRELIDKTQPQLPGVAPQPVNLSRQVELERQRQPEIQTPQPAVKDITADRQGDELGKKPEPQKRPARSLDDDPLWQEAKRRVAEKQATQALRNHLERDRDLDRGLEL